MSRGVLSVRAVARPARLAPRRTTTDHAEDDDEKETDERSG
jgi:hypothetical protein